MKQIEIKENEHNELINRFTDFLLGIDSQESYFILEKMIEMNLISSKLVEGINIFYFAHHFPNKSVDDLQIQYDLSSHKYHKISYEELSRNDWELHKQYIKEGVNPNEIAKIIRNDEIEKLQEISSQENFDFNQKIEPSLYERCSFVNKENVTLIDYAAFFGSIKCFKHLLINGVNVYNTGKYAVAGGNLEIIHLCEQNHSSFKGSIKASIKLHKNDIFKYLYENKIGEIKYSVELLKILLSNRFINFKIFNFLLEQNVINFNDISNDVYRLFIKLFIII